MAEILTPKQIAGVQTRYELQERVRGALLLEVCESHEALRAQMAKAEKGMANEFDDNINLEHLLAEAQADLRALAEAIRIQGCNCGAREESPNTHPHVLLCPTGQAMARPGVKRVLEVRNE